MAPCLPSDPPSCSAPAEHLATPLDGLARDLADAFGGTNLLWYAGAVGASAAMAWSGADASIRDGVQAHFASSTYGNVANLTGYILPVALAPSIWITGLVVRDEDTAAAGSAAVQSLAVTILTTAALKVSVGREYPPASAHTFTPYQSWSWPFPAWPSGHSSSAFSVVAALTAYYGEREIWIPIVGYPAALGIALGMLSGDEHWASDLVAGAVIGQCIGWTIGRDFRGRRDDGVAPKISLVPLTGVGTGIAVAGAW
jgi:membrane-associated phospholipid phosphatase